MLGASGKMADDDDTRRVVDSLSDIELKFALEMMRAGRSWQFTLGLMEGVRRSMHLVEQFIDDAPLATRQQREALGRAVSGLLKPSKEDDNMDEKTSKIDGQLYECHVTVHKPTSTTARDELNKIAQDFHWKTSEIERDPILGHDVYFYFTSYGSTLESISTRMDALAGKLTEAGVKVVRKKIELIVHDWRAG
jgi:hypothetical protein